MLLQPAQRWLAALDHCCAAHGRQLVQRRTRLLLTPNPGPRTPYAWPLTLIPMRTRLLLTPNPLRPTATPTLPNRTRLLLCGAGGAPSAGEALQAVEPEAAQEGAAEGGGEGGGKGGGEGRGKGGAEGAAEGAAEGGGEGGGAVTGAVGGAGLSEGVGWRGWVAEALRSAVRLSWLGSLSALSQGMVTAMPVYP